MSYFPLIDSDDRIKFNEVPITGAIDAVMQLNPVTYDKGFSGSGPRTPVVTGLDQEPPNPMTREAGFIAQEVLAVPSLAWTVTAPRDPTTQTYSLAYQHLNTYAIAALKEQQALITALTARVAALEAA